MKPLFMSFVYMALACVLAEGRIVYNVIDLGTVGGQRSEAYAINDSMQVVGYATNSSGTYRATLFDASGGGNNVDLGTLGGGRSYAFDINREGQIVGQATDQGGRWFATLFDPTGVEGNTKLASEEGFATAINSVGQVAAVLTPPSPTSRHYAYVLEPSGSDSNILLPLPAGFHISYASGINDHGVVVGYVASDQGHAYIWDASPRFLEVSAISSSASAINNLGEIVGSVTNGPEGVRAALFCGDSPQPAVILEPRYSGVANAINHFGKAVGTVHYEGGAPRAALFDTKNPGDSIDLNGLIDPSCGWTLTGARDINDHGMIVGYGNNPDGETHAFLLTPRAPIINLALYKDVATNVSAPTSPASDAVDGSLDSEWNAGRNASVSSPAWLVVDLGSEYALGRVVLYPPHVLGSWAGCYIDYRLYVSTDNNDWQLVSMGRLIDVDEPRDEIVFGLVRARYVKFEAYGGTRPAGLAEMEVYPAYRFRWYVDMHACGNGSGLNWPNAFTGLSEALEHAEPGEEIWVAEGTYRPRAANEIMGDRTASFRLVSGVEVYGGFPMGGGEWMRRDPDTYPTILSGDLAGDDQVPADIAKLRTEATRAENAYHVVTATGVDETAVLDGFVITGGNANAAEAPHYRGGGVYVEHGSPTIKHCRFVANTATYGGGLYNYSQGSPVVRDCEFTGNAGYVGGALTDYGTAQVNTCTLMGNRAMNGGAFYGRSPTFSNCIVAANKATGSGGGLWTNASPVITLCTIADNTATTGGGLYATTTGKPTLVNSILWGNSAGGSLDKSAQIAGGGPVIYYSTVQGWLGGDPLFVDPDSGDYHLQSHAGRWDPETETWVSDYATSPAIDAGSPFDDIGGEPEPHGGRINQGAYGGTAGASKSLSGMCRITDLNKDGVVDVRDFVMMAADWLKRTE